MYKDTLRVWGRLRCDEESVIRGEEVTRKSRIFRDRVRCRRVSTVEFDGIGLIGGGRGSVIVGRSI